MKKLISFKMQVLALIIVTSTFLIFNLNKNNNIDYLSIGDGYAKGINSFGVVDYGYSDYFKDYLKNSKQLYSYENKFCEDDMSIILLQQYIKSNKNNIKQYLQTADLITISIGINDLRYALTLEDDMSYEKLENMIDTISDNYKDLILSIQKYFKGQVIVVGYPIYFLEDYYFNLGIRKLNSELRKNSNITFVSTDVIENNSSKYFSNPNSNYPNIYGYKLISDKVIEKYEKSLKKY